MRLEHFSAEDIKRIQEKAPEVKQAFINNVRNFPQYDKPALLVGDQYPGIWLEHNHDALFLAEYSPEAAWTSQLIFMDHQREDGLLPFCFPLDPNGYFKTEAPYWHVQTIYPFARCAFEIAKKTNRPKEDFQKIYQVAAKYDKWLATKRNRSNIGLVEMYCEYDTGHDNSPRVTSDGIPHTCPDKDANNMPNLPCMPILAADLSATLFGGRVALAEIALYLGDLEGAQHWTALAKETQALINQLLYDPEDNFFYDRSPNGLRKYKTEHITRLFMNHVLTQEQFDSIYDQYFTTPGKAFLPDFPFPAISIDDPSFVKECPQNSWGSNAQANTALRTLFWMDYYGRSEDQTAFLSIWLKAIMDNGFQFIQELNPFTGKVVAAKGNYTPSLIIFLQAAKRLGFID